MNNKSLFFAPAAALLGAKLLLAFYALLLSLKDYRYSLGIWRSPGAGFKHFSRFFGSVHFGRLFSNTILLGIVPVVFTCIIAAIFIFCIANMPNRLMKYAALTIIAIPAFTPSVAFSGLVVDVFSSFFVNPTLYLLCFTFMDALKNVFVPVVIGLLATNAQSNKILGVGTAVGVYALFRFAFMFSPDIETIYATSNVSTYLTSDVLETYIYRGGFVNADFSFASAVWVVKTFFQLIAVAAAGIGIFILGQNFTTEDKLQDSGGGNGALAIPAIAGFVLFAIPYLFFAICLLGYNSSSNSNMPGMWGIIGNVLANPLITKALSNSFLYTFFGSVIFVLVALVTAYPLTFKTKLYPFVLILILAMSNNLMGGYLFARGIGSVNTAIPVLVGTGFSVMGAFALYFAIRNKFSNTVPDLPDYLQAVMLPSIALFCAAFILNWGGYFYEVIYLSDSMKLGIGNAYRRISGSSDFAALFTGNTGSVRAAVRFIMAFVPVGLGVVLIWLDAFLPVPILQLFTAQVKK